MIYGGKISDETGECERPARFWVNEVLHGPAGLPSVVSVDVCQYAWIGHKSHIVYATIDADGNLDVPVCEFPTWLGEKRAAGELDFLRRVLDGLEPIVIAGIVSSTTPFERVPGAVVTAVGPLGSYTTLSDSEGRYRFSGIVPGEYVINVRTPSRSQVKPLADDSSKTDMLLPGGCAWRELYLSPPGHEER